MSNAPEALIEQVSRPTSNRLLLVEDSNFFQNVVIRAISKSLPHIKISSAATMAEAQILLENTPEGFFLALLDLNLPDSSNGEIVDAVLEYNIPSIVFTGQYDEHIRTEMLARNILDYVIKDTPSSLDYIVSMVRRTFSNRFIRALVVDDSRTSRHHLTNLLKLYQFEVLSVDNGHDALEMLLEDKSIKLLIADHYMPNMSGFELINAVRRNRPRHELAIIGVSASGGSSLSAKFIKYGANDFINKPFMREEFFCRVTQNVDLLESIEALKDAANMDFLTGLPNRRQFFELGERYLAQAKRDPKSVIIANLDIDFFKKVNDTYGHDAGDTVLKGVAALLADALQRPTDIAARMGGEEFAFCALDMSLEEAEAYFNTIRSNIEAASFHAAGSEIKVTVSIGLVAGDNIDNAHSLNSLLNLADEKLYDAKNGGRNKVVASSL